MSIHEIEKDLAQLKVDIDDLNKKIELKTDDLNKKVELIVRELKDDQAYIRERQNNLSKRVSEMSNWRK